MFATDGMGKITFVPHILSAPIKANKKEHQIAGVSASFPVRQEKSSSSFAGVSWFDCVFYYSSSLVLLFSPEQLNFNFFQTCIQFYNFYTVQQPKGYRKSSS